MTYKTSDIVKKAEQLADLTNTDFITWNEKISLLNDAYTMLYQKLVNIGDGSFVKPFVAERGENILPSDFWQIKSVNLVQNKIVTPVKRRASSENYSSLSYEVRYDRLYINGDYSNGEVVVEYWAKPKTLTYKPNPVVLTPEDLGTLETVHDEKFFYYSSNKLYWYDCKDSTTGSTSISGVPTLVVPTDEQILVLYGNDIRPSILNYNGIVGDVVSGIPFITESGLIGSIYDGKGHVRGHIAFDYDYDINAKLVVCDDNFTDFFYLRNSTLYHNGEQVLVNGSSITVTKSIMYSNGNCWYYNPYEVGYVDPEDNLHILTLTNGVVGINKIDCNTGYGYTIKNGLGSTDFTVYPWVEDTVLDFPNSMYFTIMSYMLAVQFKIKQGADAQGLLTVLSTLENTFYDTLAQDANEPIRIKNVY